MRGVVEQFGLSLGFFRDLDEGVGEGIEGVFVLGLGRLDHQRFVDDQREVVCGWSKEIVRSAGSMLTI